MSEANTLFEIDRELDSLLDQIEEEAEESGTASPELLERFQQFCQAESDKVDRIGRFLTLMDSRLRYCRQQAENFQKRARSADAKHKEYGALFPDRTGTQEDRRQGVHAAPAKEQPRFRRDHKRRSSPNYLP
jgi:small-conductance mechanosensitive channel